MRNSEDERLARSMGEALRDSETLDTRSRQRLAAARARAVETERPSGWAWWSAAGALATMLLVALWVPQLSLQSDGPDGEMIEMLASDGNALDPALVEDLDLLTWMEDPGESA